MDRITDIKGREILNAKGKPTVEAELTTERGIRVTASVPSGTSRGKYEAFELYDKEARHNGYGTRKAAGNISGEIREILVGMDATDQEAIDTALCRLDGTPDKRRLGGNALLAASVAAAKAGAAALNLPVYRYLKQGNIPCAVPDILATVIAGGAFSTSGLEFEDYMAVLHGFEAYPDALDALCALRTALERNLRVRYGDFPEDGGALAAPLSSSRKAFQWILDTAEELGYSGHINLGLDVAASELWDPDTGCYRLNGGRTMSPVDLAEYYAKLCKEFPLTLIEDGLEQDDFPGFAGLTRDLPRVQIIGDDLFATNISRLQTGIKHRCANGILLKINQIGTVTEAIGASRLAKANGMDVIVSLRSGETADDFIADLAVAVGARQIKLGSPVRMERNTKYNRLMKIWQELGV
ncbi:MAG: phosphopyruvate hydratase [Clostridium sp.]|nr:phosphopyruvate hydratase [Clostridium sp.]